MPKRYRDLPPLPQGQNDSGIEDFSSDEEPETSTTKSVSEILAQKARKFKKKKIRLACIATNIVQDSSRVSNVPQLKLWTFLICFALGFDSSEGKKVLFE